MEIVVSTAHGAAVALRSSSRHEERAYPGAGAENPVKRGPGVACHQATVFTKDTS